jgi:hypothetical protein
MLTYIQREGKVSVETGQQHEQGRDEVVDGCSPRAKQVDWTVFISCAIMKLHAN